jgi:hypothetical protein
MQQSQHLIHHYAYLFFPIIKQKNIDEKFQKKEKEKCSEPIRFPEFLETVSEMKSGGQHNFLRVDWYFIHSYIQDDNNMMLWLILGPAGNLQVIYSLGMLRRHCFNKIEKKNNK